MPDAAKSQAVRKIVYSSFPRSLPLDVFSPVLSVKSGFDLHQLYEDLPPCELIFVSQQKGGGSDHTLLALHRGHAPLRLVEVPIRSGLHPVGYPVVVGAVLADIVTFPLQILVGRELAKSLFKW